MDDFCFVSVAFGSAYIDQQDRLRASILLVYPKANLLFFRGRLPDNSLSFIDSLYGFKVHAIAEAYRQGFKRVLWLDPAMMVNGEVEEVLNFPAIAVKDDNKLCNYISDRALYYNNLTRKDVELRNWHLVGGSLYYFDFGSPIAYEVFTPWAKMERQGLFGSQAEEASEQLQGHRSDETCMALSLYLNGHQPVPGPDIRYRIQDNPIFSKFHFK